MRFFAFAVIVTSILTLGFCSAVEEITSTEFSSGGFKITKVMTNPKKLNALGKMAQFGDSNEVGKYTELSKDLPPEEQGEELVINWQYTGTEKVSSLTLRVEYITGKIPEARIYEKAYAVVEPGAYELVLKNIGDSYANNGEIAHWHISLLSKNTVFAYRESRMWGAFQSYIRGVKAKDKPSSAEDK